MSIIQDALKKAQEDRKKKNSREVPYHLSGVQKKSKTVIIYAITAFCVAAVFAWLYIPYFHKPKQTTQPVVIQPPAPAKPVQATIIEKTVALVIPNNKQEPTSAKITIAPVQKMAISSPLIDGKTRAADTKLYSKTHRGDDEKRTLPTGGQAQVRAKRAEGAAPSGLAGGGGDASPRNRGARQGDNEGESMKVTGYGTQNIIDEPVRAVEKKTDDANIDTMYNEASREQQSGRAREAKTIYKQILAKQPSHIETLNNLGVIAIQEGNTQEALFYFKRVLEYRKNYAKAYNNIGLIAMKDGDRQLAEEYLRKAISLEPDDPGPYVNLSALLRSQGRLQEASKLLEIPIQKKMKDPDLLLSYAVIRDNLGQYEDAARYYRQYLSLIHTPTSRKDIIERLQYIEKKIITNDTIKAY